MNIISGALELKNKTAEDIMTRLEDAFMLPITSILDFNTVSEISKKGYSRIPVYDSERKNIVGLLHSKDLTFIDPDDKKALRTIIEFYRHPLIHTDADEKLNNVLNHFKYGKSHLAFVRKLFNSGDEDPYYEIIGLVTLEDVIEEILQIEIVDETDILTDNRKKQKRKGIQRQDFSDFAKIGESELGTQFISPQMALATFQYLSTAIEPFKTKYINENILRRLIGQNIYYYAQINELEDRTYSTANSFSSLNNNEDESKLLYKYGKPADYFIMIIEGRVKVIVGNEKLTYESGPFTYFGVSALKPPAFMNKILLRRNNSYGNNISTSISALNTINSNLNQQTVNTYNTINSINSRQMSPDEAIPLLENHPSSILKQNSGPNSPEMLSIRSQSSSSELYLQGQNKLEAHSFIPDFTVKPIENTLYMKIPRKVYLAALKASLIDRKDEFLKSDLDTFKEEIDSLIYNRLSNNRILNNQQIKLKKSSSEIIKDKKFSISSIGSHLQQKLQQQFDSQQSQNQTTIINTNNNNQIIIKQQQQQQLIDNKQSSSPSNKKRKFIKHQSMPTSTLTSNLSGTNLVNLSNKNSYTTINNNNNIVTSITNTQQNIQLETILIGGDSTKEIKKTKF